MIEATTEESEAIAIQMAWQFMAELLQKRGIFGLGVDGRRNGLQPSMWGCSWGCLQKRLMSCDMAVIDVRVVAAPRKEMSLCRHAEWLAWGRNAWGASWLVASIRTLVSPVSTKFPLWGEGWCGEFICRMIDRDSERIRPEDDRVMGALLASCRAVLSRWYICRTCSRTLPNPILRQAYRLARARAVDRLR